MCEAVLRCERGKIFRQITGVIGLVEILREQLQHPVVVRLVAVLQRVKKHEAAARLEHARKFTERLPPHLGRQLVKQEYTRDCILARIRQRDGLGFGDYKIEPAPALEMSPRLRDIVVRQVETNDGKARPGLLDKVDQAPGATADVKKLELPLIASRKGLVQRNERLATDHIGRAVEQHLDLDVVALRGVVGEPAAGLEMEVLQIVCRSFAARFIGEYLALLAAFAAAMDIGQILEEKPRTTQELEQRAVVIGGQRIDAGFDIG